MEFAIAPRPRHKKTTGRFSMPGCLLQIQISIMKKIIAHLFPNNEIRVRLGSSPPPRDIFKSSSEASSDGGFLVSQSQSETQSETERESAPRSLLDISSELRTCDIPKLPPGFGGMPKKTRFGLNARRTILRCGGAIDVDNKPSESLFLTGTLPGSTPEAMEEMCKWSSYFVDRLKSWIAKHAKNTLSMYTWELQKRGALHLHYVVVINDKEARDYIRTEFKNQWYRLLENVTSKTGIDMFRRYDGSTWRNTKDALQAYAVECKKSVAAYISKYISKQERGCEHKYFPVRWWGCSRPLLAKLRALTVTVEIDNVKRGKATVIYENCLSLIESVGLSSYEYRDKVGSGRNLAAYLPKKWIAETWNTLVSIIRPMTRTSQKSIQELSESLKTVLIELQQSSSTWKNLKTSLSGISLDLIKSLLASRQLSAIEMSCLCHELSSLLNSEILQGRKHSAYITRWVTMTQLQKSNIQDSQKTCQTSSLTNCSTKSLATKQEETEVRIDE